MTSAPALPPCPACGYLLDAGRCARCRGVVLDAPLGKPIRPGRGLPPLDALHGFRLLFATAIQLLTRPEYFGKLGGPVLVSGLAGTLLAAVVLLLVQPAYEGLVGGAGWLRDVSGFDPDALPIVLTLVTAALLVPGLLLSMTVAALDPLAGAVERMLGGPGLVPVEPSTWRRCLSSVRASARILALQLALLLPCLLLALWPPGLVVALLVAALLIAALWLEIPFARRGYDGALRLQLARRNWARALGFGVAFELLACVPFFDVLLLAPAAAVAATVLYFHCDKGPVAPRAEATPVAATPDPSATWKEG